MFYRFRALRVNPNIIDYQGATNGAIRFINDFAQQALEEIKEYPPPPSLSTYNRTFTLFGSWRVTPAHVVSSGLVEARITNVATDPRGRRYAKYVQGNFQTAQHRITGWKKVSDYMASRRSDYRNGLQGVYRKHLRNA